MLGITDMVRKRGTHPKVSIPGLKLPMTGFIDLSLVSYFFVFVPLYCVRKVDVKLLEFYGIQSDRFVTYLRVADIETFHIGVAELNV